MITWGTQSECSNDGTVQVPKSTKNSSKSRRGETQLFSRLVKRFNQAWCGHEFQVLRSQYSDKTPVGQPPKLEFAQHCTICGKRTGPWF